MTLVSKDIPLRVKAGAVGLTADEYHAQDVITSGWTGMDELDVSAEEIDSLFAEGDLDLAAARRSSVPHRRPAARRQLLGAGPGERRETGAAGPW